MANNQFLFVCLNITFQKKTIVEVEGTCKSVPGTEYIPSLYWDKMWETLGNQASVHAYIRTGGGG